MSTGEFHLSGSGPKVRITDATRHYVIPGPAEASGEMKDVAFVGLAMKPGLLKGKLTNLAEAFVPGRVIVYWRGRKVEIDAVPPEADAPTYLERRD